MYILKADYLSRVQTDVFNMVLESAQGNETQILTDASKTAEDIIRTHTGHLYDIDVELAKAGTTRNYQVLSWAISIALYMIYQRIDDVDVPEKVIKNYDDTIEELKDVSKARVPLNLPAIQAGEDVPENTQGVGIIRMGSAKPRTHRI